MAGIGPTLSFDPGLDSNSEASPRDIRWLKVETRFHGKSIHKAFQLSHGGINARLEVVSQYFGTQEIRNVFTDTTYTQYMIETEAALARAQSFVGIIPTEAGKVITEAFRSVDIDYDRLSHETEIVGYPVLPLVRQLNEHSSKTSPELAKYIHWGATTQDIMDDASMLQMKEGLRIVRRYLEELVSVLKRLSIIHRDTMMAGRTHLQHALPCTFGYKCAVYLSGMVRHLERVTEIEQRCLLVQFGGAAGTLASLGSDDTGLRVRAQLGQELGLKDTAVTWHVVRDNVAEILNFLGLIGGSLGKIAYDVMIMSSNELSEVSEPFVPHRGASSTMPQKRNPISSEVILAASKLLRANAGLGLDAMVVDFERASGPWHLEWVAIPDSFVLGVGALHQTTFALSGLVVNTDSMLDNLLSTKGLIVGEAVMMGLAPFLGRQSAHDVVYAACKESIENKKPLLDALLRKPEVFNNIDTALVTKLCDPQQYLGASQLMVDRMVKVSKDVSTTNGANGHHQTNGVNGVNGVNSFH